MSTDGSARVFVFRREQSALVGELFKALAEAKLEPEWRSTIKKNATAQYGGFVNMAGLIESTEKALSKHGLVVNQTFHYDADSTPILLVTELGHSSGQFIRSILPIPRVAKVQDQKSAITYMRRSGYEALLGLAPADQRADDDGDAANSAPSAPPQRDGWRRMEILALQKIANAATPEELISLLDKAHARVADGSMDADSIPRLEQAAAERREKLTAKA
jgi:hypothetical protein